MPISEKVLGAFRLLHPRLLDVISREGYRKPTIVQEKAIPVVLQGLHTLVVAPTGSGKTEAALFPVLSKMLEERGSGLWAIYITPLRSLNRDIFERMAVLAARMGVDLRVRHGDSTEADKREFLRNPPNIMVTTPESLYFLLSVSKFRSIVRGLRFVIVDELHEMVESKRGAELAVALERLEGYAGGRVQRIGLSATISEPQVAARVLAGDRHVEIIDLSHLSKNMELVVESPTPEKRDEELAEKLDVSPATAARLREIVRLVNRTRGGVIIFTNTRDTSEILGALLKRIMGEDRVLVHHGSLSREERLRAEKKFKSGEVRVIVATSSLELGIDIGHAELVIQYMSPRQAIRLSQRVGRSGHRLGEASRGVVISTDNFFDTLESIVIAARTLRGNLEPLEPYSKPYDALAHQLAGMVLEKKRISVDEAYWVFRRTYHYRDLGQDEMQAIAGYMDYARIVRLRGDELSRGRRIYSYYYSTTMIPDTRQYPVYDMITESRIGVLDEEFVATLEDGELFVLAGRVWEVVTVEEDRVVVRPAQAPKLYPPAWEGDLIPVDWRVAREAGALLRRIVGQGESVLEEYPATSSARKLLVETIAAQSGQGLPVPSDKLVVVEAIGRLVVVFAFLGSKGAKALELALSWLIKEENGYPPRTSSTPYSITIEYPRPVSHQEITRLLNRLAAMDPDLVETIVVEALKRTKLYQWKLLHVARRMGAVEKDAKPDKRLLQSLVETVVGEEALRETIHDKIDFQALHRLLEGIREKRITIAGYTRREPSPLAKHVLEENRCIERIQVDSLPPSLLAEIVKKRLESKKVLLVCIHCGYVFAETIRDLPEKIRCPNCGSGFIAPTRLSAEEAKSLVLKVRRREKLRGQERKKWRELQYAGSLVLEYGKKAVEALAAHGIGPDTAARVLRSLAIGGEEAFYRAIVEAEQQYRRTKKYWKSA